MNNWILLLLLVLGLQIKESTAQNKTEIKKYKIKSVTEYDIKSNKNILDSKTIYDANGEVLEEYSYNKEGKLKEAHKYKRDANGDVLEDSEYGENGKLKEKRIVKHNEKGDKSEENFYNASNKLTKRVVYVYDSKGLKLEKKTYDDKGKIKSTKKIVYEY